MLLNGFIPAIGESFTFMEYTSLTGAFSRIQNQTFDNGMEHWVVTYQPTFALLTAAAGPAHVPDQASTLLLLTASLLGLVTYGGGRHASKAEASNLRGLRFRLSVQASSSCSGRPPAKRGRQS